MNMDTGDDRMMKDDGIEGFKALMNGAFICLDKEIDALVDEVGPKLFGMAVEMYEMDLRGLERRIAGFYGFSGSDDSTWDGWTDILSSAALEIFDDIREAALKMKEGDE